MIRSHRYQLWLSGNSAQTLCDTVEIFVFFLFVSVPAASWGHLSPANRSGNSPNDRDRGCDAGGRLQLTLCLETAPPRDQEEPCA